MSLDLIFTNAKHFVIVVLNVLIILQLCNYIILEKLLSLCSFQAQFSINLIGTGLKVSEATKWTSQGNYVSVKVHRSEVSRDQGVGEGRDCVR